MKKIIAWALAACAVGSAQAQPSVGVSVGFHQPGVYGRINIGELPPPAIVLPEPMIITPPRYGVDRRPIYLYVPLAHQQNWRRYCGRYNACGQPVYFVRDEWVRDRYETEHPGWDRGHQRRRLEPDEHRREGDRDRGDDRGHKRGNDRHD
jgi:hypothetical protein